MPQGCPSSPTAPRQPTVEIHPQAAGAAQAAAAAAARLLRGVLQTQGKARILVGTGNSQLAMVGFLTRESGIDWSKVDSFHLDEYVGMSAQHPASFRRWLRVNFAEKARPRTMNYMEGDAKDIDEMTRRYAAALTAEPIDLAFVGIGENGHIAFNDPPANFNDTAMVKRVRLDEASRRQQVGEGHFPDLESVPREAITVSCAGLMSAKHWICCVPDQRKARAVRDSLEGPLTPACPGSITRQHPSVAIFLDAASASLLSPNFVRERCRVVQAA